MQKHIDFWIRFEIFYDSIFRIIENEDFFIFVLDDFILVKKINNNFFTLTYKSDNRCFNFTNLENLFRIFIKHYNLSIIDIELSKMEEDDLLF